MDFKNTLTLLGSDVLTATTGYTRTHLITSGQSSVHWGNLTSTPNSLAGYGIGDAAPLSHTTNTSNPHSVTAAQVGAPTTTGTGASGTWGIGITGLAGGIASGDAIARNASTLLPNTASIRVRLDFVTAASAGTAGNYAGLLTYAPWDGTSSSTGDASYQLAFGSTAANGGGIPMLNVRKGIDSTWNSWYTLLHSGNVGTYAPTFTGTGASGTWPISVTGRATYLNTANVSDMNSIVPAGVYHAYSPANQPTPAHWHWLQMPYLETSEGWAAQIAVSFYADALWFRRQSGATWQPWCQVLHSSNYSSYALPLSGGATTGNVGICRGTWTGAALYVQGPGTTASTYGLIVTNSAGTNGFWINDAGTAYVRNSPVTFSDARLKAAIEPLTGALAIVCAIPARSWRWKDDLNGLTRYGPIAQETELVAPELVVEGSPGPGEKLIPGERPLLSLRGDSLLGLVHGAIHELAARLAALETA